MTAKIFTKNTISNSSAATLADDDTAFIDKGVTVGCTGVAAGITGHGNNNVLQIYGTLFGANGYLGQGTGQSIYVGAAGLVSGYDSGIYLEQEHASVVNEGTISGGESGITAFEAGHSIINSGHITATRGPAVALDGGTIVNSGVIQSGTGNAITVAGLIASMTAIHIENSGTIQNANPATFAILLPFQQVTLHNTGHIVGNVTLSADGDLYDGSEGTLVGLLDAGGGDDVLVGGSSVDIFQGGRGSDTLEGGGSHDVFVYRGTIESGGLTSLDTITDFDGTADHIDLDVTVSGVDVAVTSGKLREGHFDTDLKKTIGGSHLGNHHAVLFTPDAGDLAGHTYLVVEANGHAGYKGDVDYVIDVTGAAHLEQLNVHTFI